MRNSVLCALSLCLGLPAAAALAAEPTLQLYGDVDLSVTHFTGIRAAGGSRDGPAVETTGLSSGLGNGSLFGLRGQEDLGSGWQAFFVAETGFCAAGLNQADAGGDPYCSGGGFMQRQALAGLDLGGFGRISGGRQYNVQALRETAVDPFVDSYTGQIDNFSLLATNRAGLSFRRLSQSLSYSTPEWGGLGATVQYSFNTGPAPLAPPGEHDSPSATVVDLRYRTGPWVLGGDWSRWSGSMPAVRQTAGGDYELWMVYGSYDFGLFKLQGLAQQGSADGYNGRQRVWSVGVSAPLGPGAVLLSSGRYMDSMAPAPLNLDTSSAQQYAVGYLYPLSRRTQLYASYAYIDNDAPGPNRLGTALAVNAAEPLFQGVAGQASSGVALGLSYSF